MTPLDYARLAQRAYVEPPVIGAESISARAILDGSTIAFPGTNNIACWLADLDADIIEVPVLGNLHAGFWRAYQSIRASILGHLPIDVTVGHSEGAALAILCAADLCLAGRPPAAVYAFETPRVSCDAGIGTILQNCHVDVRLYRNGEDIVPMVPRLMHPWRHPVPLIELGHPVHPWPNVEDHFMERVIQTLTNYTV